MDELELAGQKHNKLTVLEKVGRNEIGVLWSCTCECGNVVVVAATHIKRGRVKSCGCLKVEFGRNKATHRDTKSKEYTTWCAIKKRCLNPNDSAYKNYGGRGITICDRWRDSYEDFLSDVGRAPSKHYSIDRIDNSGNYEPGNVKWSTMLEQSLNRRNTKYLTYNGTTKTVRECSEATGIPAPTIYNRLRRGWPDERLFDEPKCGTRLVGHRQ